MALDLIEDNTLRNKSATKLQVTRASFIDEKLLSMILSKPEVITKEAGESKSILTIPIHETSGLKISKIETVNTQTKVVSKLGEQLNNLTQAKVFPKWEYDERSTAPKIEDLVNLMKEYLVGMTNYTTLNDIEILTRKNLLNTQFKIPVQLEEAVKDENAKYVVFPNKEGGVDIIAKVKSQSNKGEEYPVVVSVTTSDLKTPIIKSYCGCPVGRDRTALCKHVVSVISATAPYILASLDYLGRGKKVPYEDTLEYWKKRTEEIQSKIESMPNNDEYRIGFAYYLSKFLMKNNLYKHTEELGQEALDFINKVVETGTIDQTSSLVETITTEIKTEKTEVEGSSKIAVIKWTPEIEEMRKKLIALIKELSLKFGERVEGEWSKLLVFGITMSADHTKPPIVLHAVGDIGTFKTTGPKVLANYIIVPQAILTYNGEDIIAKYRELIELTSKYFEIPISDLDHKAGGLISDIVVEKNRLTVYLSIPHLASLITSKSSKYYNAPPNEVKAVLEKFYSDLTKLGFNVKVVDSLPSNRILDHTTLQNIVEYRTSYLVTNVLGLIQKDEVFSNYIVTVDEGSRNPVGLEKLLTVMSTSSINESTRLIVVTDNLEPFVEVISNPRYDPLHDRTYKAVTSAIRDDELVDEYLHAPPRIKINALELLAAQKFIESIPVPESIELLTKTIRYTLEYKYTVTIVDNSVKYIRPVKRDKETNVQLDIFDENFNFIGGGRFVEQTIKLAKFFAFLNKHDYVTEEDFLRALVYTVKSRLILRDIQGYEDYAERVLRIMNKLKESLSNIEEPLNWALSIMHEIEKGNKDKAGQEYQKLINRATTETHMIMSIPILLSMIEIKLARGELDISKLPTNMKYMVAEILIKKKDHETVLFTGGDYIWKILESKKNEIKERQ